MSDKETALRDGAITFIKRHNAVCAASDDIPEGAWRLFVKFAEECTAQAPTTVQKLREIIKALLDCEWIMSRGWGSRKDWDVRDAVIARAELAVQGLKATPQGTPDTQWIKPKFPATTPEEWREFGKTHFQENASQGTPTATGLFPSNSSKNWQNP